MIFLNISHNKSNGKVYNGATKHDVHKKGEEGANLLYLTVKVLLLIVWVAHLIVKTQLSHMEQTQKHIFSEIKYLG